MAFENVHDPIQAPEKYLNKYSFIKDKDRRTYAAMMDVVDEAIGNITQAFREKGWGLFFITTYWQLLSFGLGNIETLLYNEIVLSNYLTSKND